MNNDFMRTVIEDTMKKQNDTIVKEAYEHALMTMKNDKSYLEDKEQFDLTTIFLGTVEKELVERKLMTWAQIEEDEEELTM